MDPLLGRGNCNGKGSKQKCDPPVRLYSGTPKRNEEVMGREGGSGGLLVMGWDRQVDPETPQPFCFSALWTAAGMHPVPGKLV